MSRYTDQTGRTIELKNIPSRIISLVPSQTELLFDLGLNEQVIGITKFCVHPEHWFRNKTRVGGTKNFKTDLIRELKPDLILANKEENDQELLQSLMNDFPVWISDIKNFEEALSMISSVGKITATEPKAEKLIAEIKSEFESLHQYIAQKQNHSNYQNHISRCAYLIWNDPIMIAGADTFIADMIRKCGMITIFSELNRYPVIDLNQLNQAKPSVILLSSEPFPFKEKHLEEMKAKFPGSKLLLVDGEMFSWYGSRMLKAPSYFKTISDAVFH